jgi:hypothetical protein
MCYIKECGIFETVHVKATSFWTDMQYEYQLVVLFCQDIDSPNHVGLICSFIRSFMMHYIHNLNEVFSSYSYQARLALAGGDMHSNMNLWHS